MSASNGDAGSRIVPVHGNNEENKQEWSMASRLVHADDHIATHRAVAPAMHVSTTFRYNDDPSQLVPENYTDVRISLNPFL